MQVQVMCGGEGVYTYMYMYMISFLHGMGREWKEAKRLPIHVYRCTGWKAIALEGDTAEGTHTQGRHKDKRRGKGRVSKCTGGGGGEGMDVEVGGRCINVGWRWGR